MLYCSGKRFRWWK